MSAVRTLPRNRQLLKLHTPVVAPAVSAEHVREMLLGIAYALHTTRVVGRREGVRTPTKG